MSNRRASSAVIEQRSGEACTAPTSRTTQQLIASCQGLVQSIAWKIHRKVPRHIQLEDLDGYGQLGLAQAAEDFDPTRGGQFSTYAYYRIRGAIFDGLSQMSWFSRAAYHAGRYERMSNEILSYFAEIDEPLATSPSAKWSGADIQREAKWLAELSSSLAVVQLCVVNEQGDATDTEGLEDDQAPNPQALAMRREMGRKLRDLIEQLPSDAGDMIRWAYYDGLSFQEVSQRLGISKSWTSRLHARTIRRLGKALRLLGY